LLNDLCLRLPWPPTGGRPRDRRTATSENLVRTRTAEKKRSAPPHKNSDGRTRTYGARENPKRIVTAFGCENGRGCWDQGVSNGRKESKITIGVQVETPAQRAGCVGVGGHKLKTSVSRELPFEHRPAFPAGNLPSFCYFFFSDGEVVAWLPSSAYQTERITKNTSGCRAIVLGMLMS